MSVTYSEDDYVDHDRTESAAYVPVYARKRASRGRSGGFKSWMVLAPLGVLVVGGVAAAMILNEGAADAPQSEPVAPVSTAQTQLGALTSAASTETSLQALNTQTVASDEAVAPEAAVTSTARTARAPATRRSVPVRAASAPAAPIPDSGDDVTAELNRAQARTTQTPTAPATSPVATPPAPDITVGPLNL